MATATGPTTTPPAVTETPTPSKTLAPGAVLPEGVPYRLSADEYFRMVAADIIPPERRVGLWEGHLFEKMAKKLPHSIAQNLVLAALTNARPEGWCLWSECPILVNDFSAPIPDVSLVRGDLRVYDHRGTVPQAREIGLVVEVADSSLRKNRTETLHAYARAGLPSYWVVNLVTRRVEVYSEPVTDENGSRYTWNESFEAGAEVPLVLDGREVARIPARDLLPEGVS